MERATNAQDRAVFEALCQASVAAQNEEAAQAKFADSYPPPCDGFEGL